MYAKDLGLSHIGKIIYFSDGINFSNSDYKFRARLTGLKLRVYLSIEYVEDLQGDSSEIEVSKDYQVEIAISDIYRRLKDGSTLWTMTNDKSKWEILPIDSKVEIE